jgi:predicted peptidase
MFTTSGTFVAAFLLVSATVHAAGFRELTMPRPDGGQLLYAISVPDGYKPDVARPLVLALHPGGERMRYYGSAYAQLVVEPALRDLAAVIIAPDCPTQGWGDPLADQSVMALVQKVLAEYTIDRKRVLVTGFSLGGRGTWFMASHHPDLFTAAIPMAASTGDEPLERLATMPTYIIHSRADEVVPFAPAEKNARALEAMGRPVKFEAVSSLPHYQMNAYVPALKRGGRWIAERW